MLLWIFICSVVEILTASPRGRSPEARGCGDPGLPRPLAGKSLVLEVGVADS